MHGGSDNLVPPSKAKFFMPPEKGRVETHLEIIPAKVTHLRAASGR